MRPAKLKRALMRGGVAERSAGEGYRIWRCRNRRRREIGWLSLSAGDTLRADGQIRCVDGAADVYEWAGPEPGRAAPHRLPPAAVVGPVPIRRASRTLLERAIALATTDRERERLLQAASRYLGDAERALSAQRVTMNWGTLAIGKVEGGGRGRANLPGYSAAEAARRRAALAGALGAEMFQLLDWVLVHAFSTAEIARRLAMHPRRAVKHVTTALRALAEAYDHAVPPEG